MTLEKAREYGTASDRAHAAFQAAFVAAQRASEEHLKGKKLTGKQATQFLDDLDAKRRAYDLAFEKYRQACAVLGVDVETVLQQAAQADED